MFSASCSPHMLVLQQATVSAVHVRTQYMHVGALPLTHRLAHSLVPTGAPSWNLSELGSCRPPCLSRFLPVCPYQLCLQDDIMFPAGQQPSQPTLVVCLLWDCRKSQRNIHSVRLGKPISYFSLDQSGLESLSRSLFFVCLSAAPLFHHMCTLSSSHFICHLSPNSSVSPPLIHGLRHHVSFSLCSFFPSALIKHNE